MGKHSRKSRTPNDAAPLRERLHVNTPSVGAKLNVFATADRVGYFVDGRGVVHRMPGRIAEEAVKLNG